MFPPSWSSYPPPTPNHTTRLLQSSRYIYVYIHIYTLNGALKLFSSYTLENNRIIVWSLSFYKTVWYITMLKPLTVDHNKLWKILKEMEIPDHLTCLLRNLYVVKKQQLELGMKQQTSSKLGKEYIKAVYCLSAYLTSMQSKSCEMLDWMNQDCWEKYQQPQICRWYYLNGRNWRGTKEPLDESETRE